MFGHLMLEPGTGKPYEESPHLFRIQSLRYTIVAGGTLYPVWIDLSQEILDRCTEVDAELLRLRELGDFGPNTLDRLMKTFLPERISDTLNIESIFVNPRLTRAVLEGLAGF